MHRLYEFSNAIGLKKTSFRDLDELTYPVLPLTQKPVADQAKIHHALYDAQIQADIIRWVETEADLDIKRQHDDAEYAEKMRPRNLMLRGGAKLLGPRRHRP